MLDSWRAVPEQARIWGSAHFDCHSQCEFMNRCIDVRNYLAKVVNSSRLEVYGIANVEMIMRTAGWNFNGIRSRLSSGMFWANCTSSWLIPEIVASQGKWWRCCPSHGWRLEHRSAKQRRLRQVGKRDRWMQFVLDALLGVFPSKMRTCLNSQCLQFEPK